MALGAIEGGHPSATQSGTIDNVAWVPLVIPAWARVVRIGAPTANAVKVGMVGAPVAPFTVPGNNALDWPVASNLGSVPTGGPSGQPVRAGVFLQGAGAVTSVELASLAQTPR